MRLYFCRFKNQPENYVDGSAEFVDDVSPTTTLSKTRFATTKSYFRSLLNTHAELELCCIDAPIVKVVDDGDGLLDAINALGVPNADATDVQVAIDNFEAALKSLQQLAPTMFCETDDGGAVSEYAGIEYDADDERIYVNLEYPKRGINGLNRMHL